MPQKDNNVIKLKDFHKTRLITGPIKVIRINKSYKNTDKIISKPKTRFERENLTRQLQNHKMLFEVNKNKMGSNKAGSRENQLKSYFPALKPMLQAEKKPKQEASIFAQKPKIIRRGEYVLEPIKPSYKPRPSAPHKTQIIFMSNSRTSQPRTRRRNRPKKNQKRESPVEEDGEPDASFDVENDKLTAAWHSLVASVHRNSDPSGHDHDDLGCFEFCVDTTRRSDLKPSSNGKVASRPASGEKRTAECSLSSGSSPDCSDNEGGLKLKENESNPQVKPPSGPREKTSSLVKKFRRRKILRREECIVKQSENASSSVNTLSVPIKNEKDDIVPLRLRQLPDSFWKEPQRKVKNNYNVLPPLPPVQPLFEHSDDVTSIRPVESRQNNEVYEDRKEEVRVTGDVNLLWKLFEDVESELNNNPAERKHNQSLERNSSESIVENDQVETEVEKSTLATNDDLDYQKHQLHDDNPYIIESISSKLLSKLNIDPGLRSLLRHNCDVTRNKSTCDSDIMMTLPQLSQQVSTEGYSLLLSEVASVL